MESCTMKGIRRSLSTRHLILESVRLPVGIGKHATKRRGTLKMNCNTVVYASSSMDGETSRRLVEDADSVSSVPQSSSSTTKSIKPKQFSISFLEAMTFRGPVPEKLNGRLAMLMFYPLIKAEMETGKTALQQFAHPDWKAVVLAIFFIYGTIAPALKGVKDENFFGMTVKAEKVNGRVAMLGWLGLILAERYAGTCFF